MKVNRRFDSVRFDATRRGRAALASRLARPRLYTPLAEYGPAGRPPAMDAQRDTDFASNLARVAEDAAEALRVQIEEDEADARRRAAEAALVSAAAQAAQEAAARAACLDTAACLAEELSLYKKGAFGASALCALSGGLAPATSPPAGATEILRSRRAAPNLARAHVFASVPTEIRAAAAAVYFALRPPDRTARYEADDWILDVARVNDACSAFVLWLEVQANAMDRALPRPTGGFRGAADYVVQQKERGAVGFVAPVWSVDAWVADVAEQRAAQFEQRKPGVATLTSAGRGWAELVWTPKQWSDVREEGRAPVDGASGGEGHNPWEQHFGPAPADEAQGGAADGGQNVWPDFRTASRQFRRFAGDAEVLLAVYFDAG